MIQICLAAVSIHSIARSVSQILCVLYLIYVILGLVTKKSGTKRDRRIKLLGSASIAFLLFIQLFIERLFHLNVYHSIATIPMLFLAIILFLLNSSPIEKQRKRGEKRNNSTTEKGWEFPAFFVRKIKRQEIDNLSLHLLKIDGINQNRKEKRFFLTLPNFPDHIQ